jgi:hypothetical protein
VCSLLVVANAQGIDSESIRFADGDQQRIDIFTMLSRPLHPVVFSSLMKPMARQWDEEVASQNVREFWNQRRSRSLPEFIPVSPKARKAMVRGWYAGRLLGQVEIESTGRVMAFWPDQERMVPFPFPYLKPQIQDVDRLAAVLEMLPIALLKFHTQPNDASSLEPYRHLLRLGDYADFRASPLGRYILSGEVDKGAPSVDTGTAVDDGTAESGSARRQGEIAAQLGGTFAAIDQAVLQAEARTDDRFFKLPALWELREDVFAALDSLRTDTEALGDQAPTGGPKV